MPPVAGKADGQSYQNQSQINICYDIHTGAVAEKHDILWRIKPASKHYQDAELKSSFLLTSPPEFSSQFLGGLFSTILARTPPQT
jgi:hypothetical protein